MNIPIIKPKNLGRTIGEMFGYAMMLWWIWSYINIRVGWWMAMRISWSSVELLDDPYGAWLLLGIWVIVSLIMFVTAQERRKKRYASRKTLFRSVLFFLLFWSGTALYVAMPYLDGGVWPYAAYEWDLATIQDLYKKKKPDTETESIMLSRAAQKWHADIIAFLLTQWVDPDSTRDDWLPAVQSAILWWNAQTVNAFLDAWVNIESIAPSNQYSLLQNVLCADAILITKEEQKELIDRLISLWANMDHTDMFDYSIQDTATLCVTQDLLPPL